MSTFIQYIDRSYEGCSISPYIDNWLRKSLQKPDSFVFSEGTLSQAAPKDFPMANPVWGFTECTYNSDDDRGDRGDDRQVLVDEDALDLMVNRMILAALASKDDSESFGITDPDDGTVDEEHYTKQRPAVSTPVDKNGWKKKSRRLRRESKREKKVENELLEPHGIPLPKEALRGTHPDGCEMVCMPLPLYRDTVVAEIESRSRNLYYFFAREARHFDEIKVNAMKDSFFWHEKTKKLEKLLELKDAEISILKEQCDSYEIVIEEDKRQKRHRRDVKKQRRKAKKTTPADGSEDAIDGENQPF